MDLRISLINRGSVALCSPVWRLHRHQEWEERKAVREGAGVGVVVGSEPPSPIYFHAERRQRDSQRVQTSRSK